MLSVHVPDKLKCKIWKGEYIELAIYSPLQMLMMSRVVSHLTLGRDSWCGRNSQIHGAYLIFMFGWMLSLFFMDIVVERYPRKSRDLLHYMSIIRRLAHI